MDLSHRYTRLIIDECKEHGLLRNQCAYVLATAWHETGRYRWLREIWGPTSQQRKYEPGTGLAKRLGNTHRGDGKRFMGRGFVHITGRRNYADWSRRTGLPLTDKPELAEKPDVAVGILVEGMKLGTFTGKKLSDYITLSKSQFYEARRIVNGRDKASMIADYARKFDALLLADGYGVEKAPEKPTSTREAPQPTRSKSGGKTSIAALIVAAVAGVAAWLSGWACSIPIIERMCS